jgi:hypothetical protein
VVGVTAEELRQVVADEVAAYRLMNGEPSADDISHLVARVRALVAPESGDIEAEVRCALSQTVRSRG